MTGKGGGVNVVDEIEKRLRVAGMLPRRKIPWSTANRLPSSKGLRNWVGISVVRSRFQLTHDEGVVLPVFRRVAEDLANKVVVLGDLWNTEGKRAYLDGLEAEGVLPLPSASQPAGPSKATAGKAWARAVAGAAGLGVAERRARAAKLGQATGHPRDRRYRRNPAGGRP